jgi:hypothetical protein
MCLMMRDMRQAFVHSNVQHDLSRGMASRIIWYRVVLIHKNALQLALLSWKIGIILEIIL